MKKLTVLLSTAFAAIGLASSASAAGIDLYNAHEFDLDLFGTRAFSGSDSSRLLDSDSTGGGAALTYFITRYLGFGADGTVIDASGDTLVTTSASAIFRLPLGESGVSLYGVGGFGWVFNAPDLHNPHSGSDSAIFEGHIGGGAEWRFTPTFGIFADYRYNFLNRSSSDYGAARAGLRFAW